MNYSYQETPHDQRRVQPWQRSTTLCGLLLSLGFMAVGCGGGGGGGSTGDALTPMTPVAASTQTLVGTVVGQNAVSNAAVTIQDSTGTVVGTTTTNSLGLYSLTFAATSKAPFLVEAEVAPGTLRFSEGGGPTINVTPFSDVVLRAFYAGLSTTPEAETTATATSSFFLPTAQAVDQFVSTTASTFFQQAGPLLPGSPSLTGLTGTDVVEGDLQPLLPSGPLSQLLPAESVTIGPEDSGPFFTLTLNPSGSDSVVLSLLGISTTGASSSGVSGSVVTITPGTSTTLTLSQTIPVSGN